MDWLIDLLRLWLLHRSCFLVLLFLLLMFYNIFQRVTLQKVHLQDGLGPWGCTVPSSVEGRSTVLHISLPFLFHVGMWKGREGAPRTVPPAVFIFLNFYLLKALPLPGQKKIQSTAMMSCWLTSLNLSTEDSRESHSSLRWTLPELTSFKLNHCLQK